ncbi:26S protease regulatory subunit 4 -like protein [Capsicum chinense]|nr:26S protease regulatory subunit 4 -like protein [Capsicum chinense]
MWEEIWLWHRRILFLRISSTLFLELYPTVSLMTNHGIEKFTWEKLLSRPPLDLRIALLSICILVNASASINVAFQADVSLSQNDILLTKIWMAFGAYGTKHATRAKKVVANSTLATFLRVVGSQLIQKYLGDGPKLVRELFRVADDFSPSIIFIGEIGEVGTKRFVSGMVNLRIGYCGFLLIKVFIYTYDAHSGGECEIQRTMLELLNQLDGFDSRGDVKVILSTNKISSLDPAFLRPGR